MIKEVDKRNFAAFSDTEERRNRFMNIAIEKAFNIDVGGISNLPEINSWTGNLRNLKTTKPIQLEGSLVEKAMNYLHTQKESFGFEETEVASFSPDPHIAFTSSGHSVVNMQQVYKGIPVFLVSKGVIFNPNGEIEETTGDSVSFNEEVDIEPKVTVLEAAAKAAECILSNFEVDEEDGWGEKLAHTFKSDDKFTPKKIVEFQKITSKPTVLDKSIFADNIRANLVIFYLGPNAVLGWYFTIEVDDTGFQCDIVTSANDPANIEVLYFKRTSHSALAKGNVFKRNGGEPKEWVDFPLKRMEYPLPNNTVKTFKEWVLADETRGGNVIACLGDTIRTLRGALNGEFIAFNPKNNEDEQILNIFYFCNYMHDFFYLLGFNETAGSFEGDDPLIARVHNASISGTANMSTPVDGSSPIMNMGLVTNSGRHTALDADVVFHEYVHGVTNRLVGGRINDRALQEDQSKAMGEGWSDYFALSIQNFTNSNENTVIGSWVKNSRAGIRSHPYNDQFDQHLTYDCIGQVNGEHRRGELWCATLMHWTRHLSATIGKEQAYYICWQSIIDGLKLTNANPSFLNARDGIFRALKALGDNGSISLSLINDSINQFKISFAKFGMGVNAKSQGPWVTSITGNFDI